MKRLLILTLSIWLFTFTCYGQKPFKIETDFPCQFCGPYTIDLDTLKRYSETETVNIFNQVLHSGITFDYPQGGCQQRAEIMHLMLKHKFHISHAKIWLFAPKDLIEGNNTLLKIQDPNHLVAGDTIAWGYHVAPCIVRTGQAGQLDTMVIDPSLDKSGPLTIHQWFGKMKNAKVSKYTFLAPEWYFFNTANAGLSTVLNGFFYNYGTVQGNTKTTYDQLVLERELAINDVAIYLREKLKAGAPDPRGNFKMILSDVSKMINFFSPQERYSPSFWPVTYRDILYDNPDLAAQCSKFFFDRFSYWVDFAHRTGI